MDIMVLEVRAKVTGIPSMAESAISSTIEILSLARIVIRILVLKLAKLYDNNSNI